MVFLRRLLTIPVFQIDTNLINARQKILEVNQLEKWSSDGVILINMSSIARGEATAGAHQARLDKANKNIFTVSEPINSTDPLFLKIQQALFENEALDKSKSNDVSIVCEASKYAAVLVTNDGNSKTQPGGILGNRHKIKDLVNIMSPVEAVDFIKIKIKERDDYNQFLANKTGKQLPAWSGCD